MVQTGQGRESIRLRLVSLLPRLRRLAVLLAGGAEAGDALLRRACGMMLDNPDRYDGHMAFDLWALAEIYRLWLEDLRTQKESAPPARPDTEQLRARLEAWADPGFETVEIAAFLASLPPQQRIAALLVYGEGLSYADTAKVLDTSVDTVASRVSRALALLVARLGLQPSETIDAECARHQAHQDQASP